MIIYIKRDHIMLFIPIKFKTFIYLSASELDAKYQDRIYDKLKKNFEGLCTKYGFIKPDSIEIIKKSQGTFIKEYFNGFIKFELHCRAETCNPVHGNIVNAVIKNKNQLGILAESTIEINGTAVPILDIIIPIKSAGIISQINLDTLKIGDPISVEVMGKKYQIKDRKISIIGRVISNVKKEEEIVEVEEEEEVEADLEEEVYLEDEEEEDEGDEEPVKKGGDNESKEKEVLVDEDNSSVDSEEEEEEEEFYESEGFEEDLNEFDTYEDDYE